MGGKRKLQDIALWSWRKTRVTKHMGVQAKEHGRVPCRPHVIGQVNNQLFIDFNSREVARENYWTWDKATSNSCWLTEIYL